MPKKANPEKADKKDKSFWTTLPGIITALAALLTAIGSFLVVLHQIGMLSPSSTTTNPSTNLLKTPAVSPTQEQEKEYSGQLFSMYFQRADLGEVLDLIAEVSSLNLHRPPNLSGTVTMRLVNVPWDQALDIVLKMNDLSYEIRGNAVFVEPKEIKLGEINFTEADIVDVFNLIAEVGGFNIAIDSDISGKVTVSLKDVPVGKALDIVLTLCDLTAEEITGNVLRIRRKENSQ